MADILNRLLLDTRNFDANLSKSKKSVNDYSGGVSNMAKTAGLGIGKLAGALGIAMGAGEAFNRVLNSSQALGDMTARNMDSLKMSVDQFFYSIGSGEFSSFLRGLGDIIDKAKEAHGALDQLGNTQISHRYFSSENRKAIAKAEYVARNKFAPINDRIKGFEDWKKGIDEQGQINQTLRHDLVNAVTKSIESEIGAGKLKVTMDDARMALKIDVTNPTKRDELKNRYSAEYNEYKKAVGKLDAAYQHFDKNGNVTNDRKGAYRAITREEKENEFAKLGEKYREAIVVNAMLNKYKDNELTNIANMMEQYQSVEEALYSLSIAFNTTAIKFNKENKKAKDFTPIESLEGYKVYIGDSPSTGGGGKTPPPAGGSIAAINEEIAAKNKELINATTMQARIAVQTTINELEAKKISLQIEIDKGIFKAEHGENKLSNVASSEMKGVLNSGSEKTKGSISTDLSGIQLSKIKTATETLIDEYIAECEIIDKKINAQIAMLPMVKSNAARKTIENAIKGLEKEKVDLKMEKQGKIKTPVSKNDVNLLGEYQEGLYGISQAMGYMANATGEGAAAWLSWGSSILNAVAQAIPAIKQMIPALTAKAGGEAIVGSAASGPLGWITAGAAVASIIAAFASLPKFANGGIIQGGSTFGDMNLARVNAGEMILNGIQQRKLFNLLDGRESPSSNIGGPVRFIIKGKDLEGVLTNVSNQKRRVR